LSDTLARLRAGDRIELAPGEYKGPFHLPGGVTVAAQVPGKAILFAGDEPVVYVEGPDVTLIDLVVERTVGAPEAPTLLAPTEHPPLLQAVRLVGKATSARYADVPWEWPPEVELGAVRSGSRLTTTIAVSVGSPLRLVSAPAWLDVSPVELHPGPQEVELHLSSRGVPPGTLLRGDLTWDGDASLRAIAVRASITGEGIPVSDETTTGSAAPIRTLPVLTWGYDFSRDAGERFMNVLRNRQLYQRAYGDRAREALLGLLGPGPHSFMVRRLRPKQQGGSDLLVELTLAPEAPEEVALVVERLGGSILVLKAFLTDSNTLMVIGAVFEPPGRTFVTDAMTPFRLTLLPNRQASLTPRALEQLRALPVVDDASLTEEKLAIWNAYVRIERRVAESRQFCVPFVAHNYGAATRRITFEVDDADARVDGPDGALLSRAELWERVKRARGQDVKLIEDWDAGSDDNVALAIGEIVEVKPEEGRIRVELSADLAKGLRESGELVSCGHLYYDAFGDLTQVRRKEMALKQLREGRAANSRLVDFFFDAAQVRPPAGHLRLERSHLLKPDANDDQIAAVEAVLNGQDLVLVQGPPGTGKTTVIAEICYQVARRNGRTLLASQANLAVDNALSRLVHDPVVRAIRKGKEAKVEEEGQPYLEQNVITTWVTQTATACERDLESRRSHRAVLARLVSARDRLGRYVVRLEGVARRREDLDRQLGEARAELDGAEREAARTETEYARIAALVRPVETLLSRAAPLDHPESLGLLTDCTARLAATVAFTVFRTSLSEARLAAARLGIDAEPAEPLVAGVMLRARYERLRPALQRTVATARLAATEGGAFAAAVAQIQQGRETLKALEADCDRLASRSEALAATAAELQAVHRSLRELAATKATWLREAAPTVVAAIQAALGGDGVLRLESLGLPPDLLGSAASPPEGEALSEMVSAGTARIRVAQRDRRWREQAQAAVTRLEREVREAQSWLSAHERFGAPDSRTPPVTLGEELPRQLDELTRRVAAAGAALRPRGGLVGLLQRIFPPDRQPHVAVLREALARIAAVRRDCEAEEPLLVASRLVKDFMPLFAAAVDQVLKARDAALAEESREASRALADTSAEARAAQERLRERQEACERTEAPAKSAYARATEALSTLERDEFCPPRLRKMAAESGRSKAELVRRTAEFADEVEQLGRALAQLVRVAPGLDPGPALVEARSRLRDEEAELSEELRRHRAASETGSRRLAEIGAARCLLDVEIDEDRAWWESTWATIPETLRPGVGEDGLHAPAFLAGLSTQFDAWEAAYKELERYLGRYETFVRDWTARLRKPSSQDKTDLLGLYLDNANIVGITCSQAASAALTRSHKPFDVVIIDEVSKCTPPEVLIPALKGAKLVLIGDTRQLPPMLDDRTLREIAEDVGLSDDEIRHLEEASYFKELYEAVPEANRAMLSVQYRMHPEIMQAINQFYGNRLRCGLRNSDQARDHGFELPWLPRERHLVWVDTPLGNAFHEERVGTSATNEREVAVIERICAELNEAWMPQLAMGRKPKELGIITFYGAQWKLLRDRFEHRADVYPALALRTGTVDRFQGMEREVVIVSMVRNNLHQDIGFAKKPERINVAFSRAQQLLVVVGSQSLFCGLARGAGQAYRNISDGLRRHEAFIDAHTFL
jgi:hypothetical protein